MLEKLFKLKERKTNVKTEIMAGLTTFFALAYIVFVNPDTVSGIGWLGGAGANQAELLQIWNAVFVASIIGAVIGTLLMAFYADLPYAQACGMGLNAFFCTSFIASTLGTGLSQVAGYQAGIVIVFLSGLVFLVLSATGAREYVAKAMPDCLKKAIPAGIGLFIAFLGFKNAGIIQDNPFTFVQFVDLHGAIKVGNFASVAPAVVAFAGFMIIVILDKLQVKGNVLIGIAVSTVLYYPLTGLTPNLNLGNFTQAFKDFGSIGITSLFNAEAWSNAFNGENIGGIFSAIILVITFCLVDMFDTIGTLYGTASQANMLDENGDPINVNRAMLCDSVATVAGGVLGTSTVTTFVESAAGVAQGGRSGLTSLVTAICLSLCLFLSPLASVIPGCATAPALMYVGVLMVRNFAKVNMNDMREAVPAFLALIMMPLTYSIANGIGIGSIAYVIITLATGKYSKKDIVVTIIALLFIFKFLTVTM